MAWVTIYPVLFLINTRRMLSIVGLQLRDLLSAIVPTMGSAAGMYAAVWTARSLLSNDISQLTKLLVMILIGALVYGILTLFFNRSGYGDVLNLIRK